MRDGIAFVRLPVRNETRVRVRSECLYCGASRVGSMLDHSIQHWEKSHNCGMKLKKKRLTETARR